MTTKRRNHKPHKRRHGRARRRAEIPDLEPPEEGAVVPALARRAEGIVEEEDDFADGRSSAGRAMRHEEDAWGRGLEPEERPFEEEDVPPRDGVRAPRSEPAPDPEEPEETPPPERVLGAELPAAQARRDERVHPDEYEEDELPDH